MEADSLETAVFALLAKLGRGKNGFQLNPISASGNNRVFILHCENEIFLLKWYFDDVTDSRDRLGTEYVFLEHAWSMGLRCIPKPIGNDLSNHLALYEYVEGRKLEANEVDEHAVKQAAYFIAQLNSQQSRATAKSLPNASEACFSLVEHFQMVDARLARLAGMPIVVDLDRVAVEFVNRLINCWDEMKSNLLESCVAFGLNPNTVLPIDERCLSPSDFGFHNALLRPDRSVCFIDFEYAGWDDPAKTIGDFFSHPGVAVPRYQFEQFIAEAMAPFKKAQHMAARARLLEPISQVKWCCIILNEFLPAGARRRNFANPSVDSIVRKKRQLDKAKDLFKFLHH